MCQLAFLVYQNTKCQSISFNGCFCFSNNFCLFKFNLVQNFSRQTAKLDAPRPSATKYQTYDYEVSDPSFL